MRIVLGVAGGIAAYKAALLLRLFTESGHDVHVVPTSAALNFVGAPTWEALSGHPVACDTFDDVPSVQHVRLGQDADLVVVAPATADLLAKAACGLADNLLTNTLLTAHCPVVMAPAMHTEMWQHPATVANVATLRERGVHIVEPASGRLTGKDSGPGRLPDADVIFAEAMAVVGEHKSDDSTTASDAGFGRWAGQRVVITAGGTREAIDPVRYLGNRSSGKMGFALAAAAADEGANVTLISSATVPDELADRVDVISIESALQMRDAVLAQPYDLLIMAAAVADFRPVSIATAKIKKQHGKGAPQAPVIELVRNPDILAEAVEARDAGHGHPIVVGFAAETGDDEGDVISYAQAKLERKGCDLLVANEVGEMKTFGQDESTVHILRADSQEIVTVGPAPKSHIAAAVITLAAELKDAQ